MAAAVASSNPHRSAVMSPTNSRVVPLRCSSSRARVSVVNPACVANPAETMMKGAAAVAADKHAAAARQQHQRYRSRGRREAVYRGQALADVMTVDHDDGARDTSPPDRKRRDSVSHHRDAVIRKDSSSHTFRRDRDDTYYPSAKKKERDERGRAREDRTRRRSVSSSGPEQRARTGRPSAAQQRHQLAVTGHHGTAVDDRKPALEELDQAAEVARKLDIQRRREEARREMDRMVKTVEFNDPFISPLDALKR